MNLKTFAITLSAIFVGLNAGAQEVNLGSIGSIDVSRCSEERQGEPRVYSGEFKWGMTLQEVRDTAARLYDSEKRLGVRAYYDSSLKQFVFPQDQSQGGKVKIPANFLKAVTRHIEKAFERGYIDAVIFPDMGHSHFLVPLHEYNRDIAPLPADQSNIIYERMMNNKNIKVVYHTAEQLKVIGDEKKLIEDKYLQWRYYTRNLVGHNNPEPDIELVNATATSSANTMGEQSGYYWWGAGFSVHANKNGCFSYKRDGKTYYFDISLKDVEPDPNSGDLTKDEFAKDFGHANYSIRSKEFGAESSKALKCRFTDKFSSPNIKK